MDCLKPIKGGCSTPPNFTEKTFADGSQISKSAKLSFLPQKFPAIRYTQKFDKSPQYFLCEGCSMPYYRHLVVVWVLMCYATYEKISYSASIIPMSTGGEL